METGGEQLKYHITTKPFGLKAMSKLIGKRVPWWDEWHKIRYELGNAYDNAFALDCDGEWALVSRLDKLEDEGKLQAFCKKYGLSYEITKLPFRTFETYPTTILICKDPKFWMTRMS